MPLSLSAAYRRASAAARGQLAFTLIELLVVILIIAILIAVALPAFLGQTNKAYNSTVEQRLATARVEAKALWTANGQSGYGSTTTVVSALAKSEPGFSFVADPYVATPAGNSPAATVSAIGVEVNPLDANEITLCQKSQSGTYYCLRADEAGQLIAVSGSGNTAAPADHLISPVTASADSGGYTDVVHASGSTEGGALCVLQAATPVTAGGTGTGDASNCAPGGYAGWSSNPVTSGSGSGSTSASGQAPANTVAPGIAPSGSSLVGTTLVGSPGTWSNAPFIYSYQWEDCPTAAGLNCAPITGANGPTYTLTGGDVGSYIALEVAATNQTATSNWTSSATTGAVIAGVPTGGQPTISGNPYIGATLTGDHGTWSNTPSSYSYQWEQCSTSSPSSCTAISNATSPTYTITSSIVPGQYIGLAITATNAAGPSTPAQATVGPVIGIPANTSAPTVSGSTYVGNTVSASPGGWSSSPTSYTYQWADCLGSNDTGCTPISGATNSTYTVQQSDEFAYLTVTVTAENAVGTSAPAHGTAGTYAESSILNVGGCTLSLNPFQGNNAQLGDCALNQGQALYSQNGAYALEVINSASANAGYLELINTATGGEVWGVGISGSGQTALYVQGDNNVIFQNSSNFWNTATADCAPNDVEVSNGACSMGDYVQVSNNGTWSVDTNTGSVVWTS